jgi:hypothetical protein
MSRTCRICAAPNRVEIDAALASGVTDRKVARTFGVPTSSVQRHRQNHVMRPAKDRLALLAKGSEERRTRQELSAAVASDEPSTQALVEAHLGTRALLTKLTGIERRLDRMNAKAEEAGSATGVAALSTSSLRALEFGAKLGGHPSFRPASAAPQAGEGGLYKIEIVFSGAGKTESIGLVRPVIDGDKFDVPPAEAELPKHSTAQKLPPVNPVSGYWSNVELPPPGPDDET